MADFDRQAAIQQKNIADQAFTAGAFGGARQGVESAEFRTVQAETEQHYLLVYTARDLHKHKIKHNNN